MPTSPVQYHHYPVFRIPGRYFIKKYLHASAVDSRQDQRVKRPISNRHGCICIGVLLGHRDHTQRANRSRTPALTRVGNTAKTCFILKHQPKWLGTWPLRVDQGEEGLEFFFHSICASTSVFVCLLSGASFRQLFLCRRL